MSTGSAVFGCFRCIFDFLMVPGTRQTSPLPRSYISSPKPSIAKTTSRKSTVQYFWSIRRHVPEICLKPPEREHRKLQGSWRRGQTQETRGKEDSCGRAVVTKPILSICHYSSRIQVHKNTQHTL